MKISNKCNYLIMIWEKNILLYDTDGKTWLKWDSFNSALCLSFFLAEKLISNQIINVLKILFLLSQKKLVLLQTLNLTKNVLIEKYVFIEFLTSISTLQYTSQSIFCDKNHWWTCLKKRYLFMLGAPSQKKKKLFFNVP